MDNYNYPMGADTSDAPWNQKENEDVEVEVSITQTLTKNCTIETNDYYIEYGDDKPNINQDTLYEKYGNYRHTIPEMLALLKWYASEELKDTMEGTGRNSFLKRLIEDCKGWEIVETDVNMI